MRQFMTRQWMFAMALLFCAAPLGAFAQSDDIRGVISAQVEAFGDNDLDRAFSFASPMIKSQFRDPDRFGAMVESGYPMVWRPQSMRFGGLRDEGGRQVQTVFYTDAAGQVYEASYEMIFFKGKWLINGVAIREADLSV